MTSLTDKSYHGRTLTLHVGGHKGEVHMGLFDKRDKGKKKKDDFDSPIEQVDLSAARAPAQAASKAPPPPRPAAPKANAKPSAGTPAKEAPRAAKAPQPDPIEAEDASYSINKAIELMRNLDLPDANQAVIVQVVKLSLESAGVKIPKIIEEATAKQKRIKDRIAVLNAEMSDLEKEIATRKDEVSRLEADHTETTDVKEQLEKAEASSSKSAPKPAQSESSPPAHNRSGTSNPSPRPLAAVQAAASSSGNKSTVVAKK